MTTGRQATQRQPEWQGRERSRWRRRWLPLCLLSLAAWGQARVSVSPDVVRDIGGYTEVQAVFGIMTGNMDGRTKPFLRDANVTGIRNIINYLPNANTPGLGYRHAFWNTRSPRFDTEAETMAWFRAFLDREPDDFWNELLRPTAGFFDDGCGPVAVTISGNPNLFDGRLEMDLDAARKHVAAYVQALKNQIPEQAESRLAYFQLHNEPEQKRNWAGQFGGDQSETVASYTRVFNALYDHLRETHPDVILVGTCVGHDGAFRLTDNPNHPGVNWQVWVRHFVDHVANPQALEFYNAHMYAMPSLRTLAYASMTQSYAERARGVRPRMVITETAAPLEAEGREGNFRNQFLYHAHNIFVMLEHPDKFASRHAFVASHRFPTTHSFFRLDPERGPVPEAPYYVLLALRNLRGTNLLVENPDSDLHAFAARRENRLTVALFNPQAEPKSVQLATGLPAGSLSRATLRQAVWDGPAENARYTESPLGPDTGLSLSVPPMSVTAVEFELARNIPATRTIGEREFFGTGTAEDMDNPVEMDLPVPRLPQENEAVWLRIGIDRCPQGGSLPVSLNGQSHDYELENAPQPVIKTWHHMVGYLEIPIGRDAIRRDNRLVLGALPNNRLLFASLVYRER